MNKFYTMDAPTERVLFALLDVVVDMAKGEKLYTELQSSARTAINDVAVLQGVAKPYPNG